MEARTYHMQFMVRSSEQYLLRTSRHNNMGMGSRPRLDPLIIQEQQMNKPNKPEPGKEPKGPLFSDVKRIISEGSHEGWCTYCEDWTHDCCEPDARRYTCPVCDQPTCFGAEETLIMGIVDVESDEDDDEMRDMFEELF